MPFHEEQGVVIKVSHRGTIFLVQRKEDIMKKLQILTIAVVAVVVVAIVGIVAFSDDNGSYDEDGDGYTYQTYEYGGNLITQTVDDIPSRVIVGNVAAL